MKVSGESAGDPAASPVAPATLLERFRQSMVCNYDRWHDGIGYDLDLIAAASPGERVEIEDLLVSRPVEGWRDVEALAALDTPRARVLLRQALRSRNHEVAMAVARHAPGLVPADERSATLVAALEGAEFYGGLTQALAQVEDFHPPEIVDALFRGALVRDGGTAVHFAAMLMFLHGKAKTSFDWDQRPFFLRFNTDCRPEREAAFGELCAKVGVDARQYLGPHGPRASSMNAQDSQA